MIQLNNQQWRLKVLAENEQSALSKGLATFGKITAKVAATMMEKIIMNLFLPFSPTQLQEAMNRNITLIDLLKELKAGYKQLTPQSQKFLIGVIESLKIARQMIRSFPEEQILQYMNTRYAFKWVLERKKEYIPILKNEKGLLFFKRQMLSFQKFFGLKEIG